MKTLNEYLRLPYRIEIVEDRNEGGFVVSYPDLPGCITCGETVESAVANALDAKREGISMNQYCVYLLSKKRCHGGKVSFDRGNEMAKNRIAHNFSHCYFLPVSSYRYTRTKTLCICCQ